VRTDRQANSGEAGHGERSERDFEIRCGKVWAVKRRAAGGEKREDGDTGTPRSTSNQRATIESTAKRNGKSSSPSRGKGDEYRPAAPVGKKEVRAASKSGSGGGTEPEGDSGALVRRKND